MAEERVFPMGISTLVGGLILSPEENQQQQERDGRQQREKGQRRRQNSSRIFGNSVYVRDDPADREKHQHPSENQLLANEIFLPLTRCGGRRVAEYNCGRDGLCVLRTLDSVLFALMASFTNTT